MSTPTFQRVDHISDARRRRKDRQAFYTPQTLAAKMVGTSSGWAGCLALEPSSGDGIIVHEMVKSGFHVHACEIDDAMRAKSQAEGAEIVGTDFLKYAPGEIYDQIIMNPPFTKGQDRKHIEHAYTLLRPGRELVAIAAVRLHKLLDAGELKLPGCECCYYERLPKDTFSESDVKVETILLTVAKSAAGSDTRMDGFCNWATWNTAIGISSDHQMLKLIREGMRASDLRKAVAGELSKLGMTPYGVNWQEVAEYIMPCKPEPTEVPDDLPF